MSLLQNIIAVIKIEAGRINAACKAQAESLNFHIKNE